jgi:hypothetical protein
VGNALRKCHRIRNYSSFPLGLVIPGNESRENRMLIRKEPRIPATTFSLMHERR